MSKSEEKGGFQSIKVESGALIILLVGTFLLLLQRNILGQWVVAMALTAGIMTTVYFVMVRGKRKVYEAGGVFFVFAGIVLFWVVNSFSDRLGVRFALVGEKLQFLDSTGNPVVDAITLALVFGILALIVAYDSGWLRKLGFKV